jgi:hypothetical protein
MSQGDPPRRFIRLTANGRHSRGSANRDGRNSWPSDLERTPSPKDRRMEAFQNLEAPAVENPDDAVMNRNRD